jgi:pimeloyl-ACP methyl ester carboxylesterase
VSGAREAGVVLTAFVVGAAAGYRAERALVRPRLARPPSSGVPLGSLEGERCELRGPDGVRLAVESYGPSEAPQLLLVHGWTNTGRVWHEQVAALSDRFRVVTYDQPGHGRSSPPRSRRYTLDLLGDALGTVIEEATGPRPLVLVGHSLGGMAVLNLLARRRQVVADRLVGVALLSTSSSARVESAIFELGLSGAARFERLVRIAIPWLRDPRVYEFSGRIYSASSDLSYLVTRWWATGPAASPEVVDFTEQLVLDSDPDIIAGLTEAILGVDEDRGLAALTVPTRIVVGDHDRLTPASLAHRMAGRAPAARLVELPGVGHMVPLEAPAAVNALLEELVVGGAAGGEVA